MLSGHAISHTNCLDAERAREAGKAQRKRLEGAEANYNTLLGPGYSATLASPKSGDCIVIKHKTSEDNYMVVKVCPNWDKESFVPTWSKDVNQSIKAHVRDVIDMVKL
jgi:hypothetical protein